MIVVKLAGGMGNQMFQYAMGRLISLKYNEELILDLSFLLNRNQALGFTYRNYDLDIFKLDVKTVDSISRIYESIVKGGLDDPFVGVREPEDNRFMPALLDLREVAPRDKNIYLEGYFQKHEYVKNIRDILLEDFKLNYSFDSQANKLLNKINSSDSVCVNIRRADYVTNKNSTAFHGVYGSDYVNASVEVLTRDIQNPEFFIFSDDIEWCENNLKFDYPHFFVDHSYKGKKFGQYLYLMSSCKSFIIPNSSFAWWAAWLNETENKIVITPKNWFQDPKMDTRGLKPSNWIDL